MAPPETRPTSFAAGDSQRAILTFSSSSGHWSVHYMPVPSAASEVDDRFEPLASPILLVEADTEANVLVTHPLNTYEGSVRFLKPKYARLRTITFDDFQCGLFESAAAPQTFDELTEHLARLPEGFGRNPYYGLGIHRDYWPIVAAIESVDGATDLLLRRGRRSGLPVIKDQSYVTTIAMFDEARRAINRVHSAAVRGASVRKRVVVHNMLVTPLNPDAYPEQLLPHPKNAMTEIVQQTIGNNRQLPAKDQKEIVRVFSEALVPPMARERPTELLALSREIEVVTLDVLIARFKGMVSKKLSESVWQRFFVDNPFVLRLAFGLPVVMLRGQVSVGGRRFAGSGDTISDFAVKAFAKRQFVADRDQDS